MVVGSLGLRSSRFLRTSSEHLSHPTAPRERRAGPFFRFATTRFRFGGRDGGPQFARARKKGTSCGKELQP